jgi:class 3 adenylate cyclase/CHASE2 domain-containing sensor protein
MIKKNIKKFKKHFAAVIIVVSVFAISVLVYRFGILDHLEFRSYDFRVVLLAKQTKASEDIMVIVVNQDSIDWAQKERNWSWPWPRKAFGEIVEYMNQAGAASVIFDIIFSEPSVYGPEDDRYFAQAAAEYKQTVHTVFFSSQSGNSSTWPNDITTPMFKLNNFESIIKNMRLYNDNSDEKIKALFPIPQFAESANVIGNITGKPDSDNVYRRLPLFFDFDDKAVPGLSAAGLLSSGWNNEIHYDQNKKDISWGDYTIPVDKNGNALLRFRGNIDPYTYVPYSAAEILQSLDDLAAGREPLLSPANFEGKHIFVGLYAPGLFDICTTPISSAYPGMGMHITMMDNILQQDFIRESPEWFSVLLLFFVSIAVCLLTLYAKKIYHVIIGFVCIVFVIVGGTIGAYAAGNWVPMIAPILAASLCFVSGTLYNYATEGSQRKFIKSAFGQYLSPVLIDKLIANPELLTLGGERRELSIFFSDIQGFTSISEKMEPTQLTEFINKYLSFMTDIIQDSGGYVDKYIGDAVVAFWNAPLDQEDHAAQALHSALECQKQLDERQETFQKEYGFSLITRIGINTGDVVVGNMGSEKRFNYTMLGDSVNLGARLEGLNKQFGTHTMCTKHAFDKANQHGTFYGRKLAKVAVVGKNEAIPVIEPMLKKTYESKKNIISKFETAYDLFYDGKFSDALKIFETIKDIDPPAKYYADQCKYLLNNPSEWKGYWKAGSK